MDVGCNETGTRPAAGRWEAPAHKKIAARNGGNRAYRRAKCYFVTVVAAPLAAVLDGTSLLAVVVVPGAEAWTLDAYGQAIADVAESAKTTAITAVSFMSILVLVAPLLAA